MTPADFINTPRWRRKSGEVLLEILAVCLPILIYAVALAVAEYGITPILKGKIVLKEVSHILAIPDATFGACILFAFSVIQGYRRGGYPEDSGEVAHKGICLWRNIGVAGLVVSALIAGVSVMFQVMWSLVVGLFLLYLGGLSYKKVIFLRTYLETNLGTEDQ